MKLRVAVWGFVVLAVVAAIYYVAEENRLMSLDRSKPHRVADELKLIKRTTPALRELGISRRMMPQLIGQAINEVEKTHRQPMVKQWLSKHPTVNQDWPKAKKIALGIAKTGIMPGNTQFGLTTYYDKADPAKPMKTRFDLQIRTEKCTFSLPLKILRS